MNHEVMYGRERKKRRYLRALFVDPGTQRTGLAFWEQLIVGKAQMPSDARLLTGRDQDWFKRCVEIWSGFDHFIRDARARLLVIEQPSLWGSSAASHAAGVRGSLHKLSVLSGGLARIAVTRGAADVCFVPPNRWKGQLKKGAVDRRIVSAIGYKYTADVSDAVGMGLSAAGVL